MIKKNIRYHRSFLAQNLLKHLENNEFAYLIFQEIYTLWRKDLNLIPGDYSWEPPQQPRYVLCRPAITLQSYKKKKGGQCHCHRPGSLWQTSAWMWGPDASLTDLSLVAVEGGGGEWTIHCRRHAAKICVSLARIFSVLCTRKLSNIPTYTGWAHKAYKTHKNVIYFPFARERVRICK